MMKRMMLTTLCNSVSRFGKRERHKLQNVVQLRLMEIQNYYQRTAF